MKRKLFILITMACFYFLFPSTAKAGGGFAVIELFTSESCSSCPAADSFLIELTELAQKQGQPIYTLGFHVDYWNYLSWIDEYSRPEFSSRQRLYAAKITGSSLYTPQMIVNGRHQFGGYRKDLAKKYIDQSILNAHNIEIRTEIKSVDDYLDVTVRVDKPSAALALNIALVENGLSSKVQSGENAGRFLKHANIVREFKTINANAPLLHAALSLPADLKRENASVIAYLQNKESFEIVGAQQLPLIP